MKIFSVTDPEFKPYGRVVTGLDTTKAEILAALASTPLPEATDYVAEDAALQELPAAVEVSAHLFGGMPCQLGWCNGHNTYLNCLEYHRDSEFNLGTEDFVLLLARQEEIAGGKLDTAKVKAFRVPAGTLVEVYATTLHYAPCHVDAAKGMVSWARENAKSSGLEDAPIRWIVDDCAKFVEREIRRGRRYDAVIMDPPSYGRGPSGEIWKLEENLYPFVKLVAGVLSDRPLFFLINSYTTGLAPSVLTYLLETLLTKRYGGHTVSDELGLPVAESGLILPCGAAGRWTAAGK